VGQIKQFLGQNIVLGQTKITILDNLIASALVILCVMSMMQQAELILLVVA
jgi:hypothetical protein